MKLLIILSLIFFSFEEDVSCHRYTPVNDIKECFSKDTGNKFTTCCGHNTTSEYSSRIQCTDIGNTKATKNFWKEVWELQAKASGGTSDFQCPEKNVQIKGYCENFVGAGILVDDPKQCTKLRMKSTKDRRTCCGLKIRTIINEGGIFYNKTLYTCWELSINPKQKEEFINELNNKTDEHSYIEGYVC